MANEVYKNDPNLQGLWLMEEVSGTRVDESPNGNDLTDNNTVGSSTDSQEGSRSADFEDGNSEYLSITDGTQTGLDITGDLSIVGWIKPESLVNSVSYVPFSKYLTSGNQRSYRLGILYFGAGRHRLEGLLSSNGSLATSINSNTDLSTGAWQHVAMVYDGTDIRVYLNGSLDCTPVSYSSGIFNGSADLILGASGGPGLYYDGLMDEVAIFDRALSAAEVASVYNNGILDSPPGGRVRQVQSPRPIRHLRI